MLQLELSKQQGPQQAVILMRDWYQCEPCNLHSITGMAQKNAWGMTTFPKISQNVIHHHLNW